jgi:hypothetical protein
MPTPTSELYDDGDINAVYQAIKSSYDSVEEAWAAALSIVAIVTKRLMDKKVDETFNASAEAWLDSIYNSDDED